MMSKGMSLKYAGLALLFVGLLVSSCSIYGVKNETGNPIVEDNVKKIVNKQTTGTEIVGMFGAPTMTSSLGNNELYVYKHCRTGGSHVMVPYVGQSNTKETCNTLTVTISRTTGLVENYNYQKMFE